VGNEIPMGYPCISLAVTQIKFLSSESRNGQPKEGCICWVRGMVVVEGKVYVR
jgi:hypothetical protein